MGRGGTGAHGGRATGVGRDWCIGDNQLTPTNARDGTEPPYLPRISFSHNGTICAALRKSWRSGQRENISYRGDMGGGRASSISALAPPADGEAAIISRISSVEQKCALSRPRKAIIYHQQ